MKNLMYTFYLIVLGVVSFYTREIVTFVMLGVILIALNNIHFTLKQILKTNRDILKRNNGEVNSDKN